MKRTRDSDEAELARRPGQVEHRIVVALEALERARPARSARPAQRPGSLRESASEYRRVLVERRCRSAGRLKPVETLPLVHHQPPQHVVSKHSVSPGAGLLLTKEDVRQKVSYLNLPVAHRITQFMECDRYPENGQGVASGALAWSGGVKRKLGGVGGLRLGPAGAGGLRLGAAGAGGARAGLLAPRRRPEPRPEPRAPLPRIAQDSPFMNNMDEITYWIVTKRAPCLAGYDNPLRAAASRVLRSPSPDPEPKKKKRKLAPKIPPTLLRDQTII
ncbi:hypothetical protein MSG28_006616 [Choristoneura fumiferana]|uniref:Uncharacterized protein n=1 Tax=Choristoneura fumiferana TaxID=7141 RepID=A0ACC0JFH0_CHOFU|nr:hypothetical protein MSG28_006616 [Choristoneura fumiferana]